MGELKRGCRAFIANMRRASIEAIYEASEIATFDHSPDFRNEASNGTCCLSGLPGGGAESVLAAVSSCACRPRAIGRPIASRTKPKNRPDFEYLRTNRPFEDSCIVIRPCWTFLFFRYFRTAPGAGCASHS